MAHPPTSTPLLEHGNQEGENNSRNRGYNITSVARGTSGDYLTRRIARDRPDILERMKAGEFPTMRPSQFNYDPRN